MAVLSRQDPGRLLARTVAIPDSGDLLAQLPQPDVVAWVHRGAGLAGWGEAARVTLPAGDDRFTAGEKWLRSVFDALDVDDRLRVPGSGPVAFGTFTFDASSEGSVLVIPRVVLGRDGQGRAWLTTVTEQCPLGGDDPPETRPAHGGTPRPPIPPSDVRWHDGSLPAPQWEQAVAEAVAAIKAGALRKVVLAQDQFATAADPIDARILLQRLAARYPECYTFACDGMVGATPELLIRQAAGRSARWSWPARRRGAVTPRKTRRSARACWPPRKTPRSTSTRSPRCAMRSRRCAMRSTWRRAPHC